MAAQLCKDGNVSQDKKEKVKNKLITCQMSLEEKVSESYFILNISFSRSIDPCFHAWFSETKWGTDCKVAVNNLKLSSIVQNLVLIWVICFLTEPKIINNVCGFLFHLLKYTSLLVGS